MAEIDEFRIKATIDASGATAGADQVAQDVNKIAEATKSSGDEAEKAGAKTNEFVEHLGGMRTGRMAARELFEAFEGGGKTIEGTTMLLRMFLLTSMELDPVMAAVVGLGLAFTGMWASHQKGSEDAKNKIKGDLAASGGDVDTYVKHWVDDLKQVFDAQKQLETSDTNQIAAIKEKSRLLTEQMKLDEELAIQRARNDYLIAEATAKTPEDRKRLAEKFEATKADIQDKTKSEAAAKNVEFKTQDVDAEQKSLDDTRGSQKDLLQALQQAQDKQADARNMFSVNGITVDDKGKASAEVGGKQVDDLVAAFEDRIASAQSDANRIREGLAAGTYLPKDIPDTQKALADADARVAKATASLIDLKSAIQDRNVYDEAKKEIDPKLTEQDRKIGEQETKIATMQAELKELVEAKALADNDASQNRTQRDLDAANKKLEKERIAKGEKETPDYTDFFNTPLSPDDEKKFAAWAKSIGHENDTFDYDLRGAWKNNAKAAANGHLPDTYKKPNHPTFSDQSIYNDYENEGGKWGGTDAHPTFIPGKANLKNFSEDQLKSYFKRVEPDASLILRGDDKKENDAFRDREAKRKAQLDDINAQLKGTTDPSQKSDLEKQRAALEAAGIHDKADTEKKEGKLTPAEYNEATTRAGDTVKGATAASDKKEDIEQINQAKSSIAGTGNKDAIAAMHQIVKTVLDKQIELADLQALLAQVVANKFQHVDSSAEKTRGAISSMRNNHQS